MSRELLYNGTPMRFAPSVMWGLGLTSKAFDNPRDIQQVVINNYGSVHITLEPGDATRYDLTITRVSGKEEIVIAYHQMNTCVVLSMAQLYRGISPWDVEALSKNVWTNIFLAWWINGVFGPENLYEQKEKPNQTL